MKKYGRQIAGALIGAAITPFALAGAIASAGAGHGNYLFAKLLFPYSMLATRLTSDTITPLLIALAVAQFPLYGLVASSFSTRLPLLGLLILHAGSAAICFTGLLPIFS